MTRSVSRGRKARESAVVRLQTTLEGIRVEGEDDTKVNRIVNGALDCMEAASRDWSKGKSNPFTFVEAMRAVGVLLPLKLKARQAALDREKFEWLKKCREEDREEAMRKAGRNPLDKLSPLDVLNAIGEWKQGLPAEEVSMIEAKLRGGD